MELSFQFADTIDPVAIYAAIVATTILVWDVAKWVRSGAKLKVRTSSGMTMLNSPDVRHKGMTYVLVGVTNIGSSATTVTHLAVAHYKNHWAGIRGKADMRAIVVIAQAAPHLPLPHKLNSGEEWSGIIHQNDELLQMATDGLLYAEVSHSVDEKPVRSRIIIRDDDPQEKTNGPNPQG